MKLTHIKMTHILAIAVLGLVASTSANAVLIPFGLQTGVTQATVDSWGWTECHRSNANVYGASRNLVGCDEEYLMMGAWDASLGAYGVIGAGETAIVTAFTHANYFSDDSNPNLNNWSNGLNWYQTSEFGSWGFTTISQIAMNSADIMLLNGVNNFYGTTAETANNLAAGLSWHVNSGGTFSTGWSYNPDGNQLTQLYSAGDQRVFWTTSAVANIPEPASAALMLAGLAAFRFSRRNKNA